MLKSVASPPGDTFARVLTPKDVRMPGDTDGQVLKKLANAIAPGVAIRLDGDFIIDRQIEIVGKRDFRIFGNATIRIADGTPIDYGHSAFYLANCSDFSIEDVRIDGNRRNRSPGESAGHLVIIDACHRWRMLRVRADNGTTDGFLIYTSAGKGTGHNGAVTIADVPTGWTMEECSADNNFRQGLSVIEAIDWNILGGTYSRTNGLWDIAGSTGPCAGIDLEPDHLPQYPPNRLRNGRIEGVTFAGNQGAGLLISSLVSDLVVNDCRFLQNNKSAIECAGSNVRIIRPQIRGWSAGPYSRRSSVPPKRGLIDISVSAGPNIEIADPFITEISIGPAPLVMIYVHGGAQENVVVSGLRTDLSLIHI